MFWETNNNKQTQTKNNKGVIEESITSWPGFKNR